MDSSQEPSPSWRPNILLSKALKYIGEKAPIERSLLLWNKAYHKGYSIDHQIVAILASPIDRKYGELDVWRLEHCGFPQKVTEALRALWYRVRLDSSQELTHQERLEQVSASAVATDVYLLDLYLEAELKLTNEDGIINLRSQNEYLNDVSFLYAARQRRAVETLSRVSLEAQFSEEMY